MAKLNWSEEPTQPSENNGGASVPVTKGVGNPTPNKRAKEGKKWDYITSTGKSHDGRGKI